MAIAKRWANQDRYAAYLDAAAARWQVPPELINGVAAVESNFNPAAISSSGARGLLQMMPATAAGFGYKGSPDGLLDPHVNAELGGEYLGQLLEHFGGDFGRVASAYNGGDRPELGFGTRLTRPLRLCQRWNSDRSSCLQWYQAAAGEFGNQPYVDNVLEAAAYFREYLAEQGRAVSSSAAGFGVLPALLLTGVVVGGIRQARRRPRRRQR